MKAIVCWIVLSTVVIVILIILTWWPPQQITPLDEAMSKIVERKEFIDRIWELQQNPPKIDFAADEPNYEKDFTEALAKCNNPENAIIIAQEKQYQRLYKPWIDLCKIYNDKIKKGMPK